MRAVPFHGTKGTSALLSAMWANLAGAAPESGHTSTLISDFRPETMRISSCL